jgi:hypothetical protein
MNVVASVKMSFFDSEKVIKQIDKEAIGVYKKFGGFVRKAAQRSMRKAKKPSAPGRPPRIVKGHLRKLLLFFWDEGSRSVVIGPARFGMATATRKAPYLMEFGGRGLSGQRVAARPFMAPVAQEKKRELAPLFAAAGINLGKV